MADSPLIIKSKEFALQIIKVCNYVKQTKKETVLTNQLIRSGTSIGANVSEAQRGQSKADFNAKMNIALKEANETDYWLRLLHQSGYLTEAEFQSIFADCQEIEKLLAAIVKTSKK